MADELWLFIVAGGAALLGLALAFGLIMENRARALKAMAGAFVVAICAGAFGVFVSSQTTTAPQRSSGPDGSQYDLPARPSDQNAIPGQQNNTP